ncbi:hypothetical protein Tco_0879829 [Tanacetum coccineum]
MLEGLDRKILGSTLVEVILVKGHVFSSIVKVRPVGFHPYPISVNNLPSITRSSTKELFTPFKEPEQEFRSSRKLLKTLSLDESRSPEFNLFSDLEEHSEEEVAKTMAKTME